MNILSQKVIGFDMDGVIFDHTSLKQEVSRHLGCEVAPEDTPSSRLKDLLGVEKYRRLQDYIYDDPEWGMKPVVYEGFRDAFGAVLSAGASYYLVSKRNSSDIPVALLKQYGLWPQYFNEENSFFVKHKEDKGEVVHEKGITDFIDDKINYLDVIPGSARRYLFDPHRVYVGTHPYIDVDSWDSFLDILRS